MTTIRINGISSGGEDGQFRANEEVIGWRGSDGGRSEIYEVGQVRRAEWLEGKLRLLCEVDGNSEVLALDGFTAKDYDVMWKHFEQYCGVYIKKHRPQATLGAEDFDAKMLELERSADLVDEATSGSVVKQAREADLLKKVEVVRDGLDKVVGGDKQALSAVFSVNGCEPIGRLRLVLRTVQVEFYKKDARFVHLKNLALTIESVLKELGAFRQWRPSEDASQSNLLKRQMVWELRKRQGEEVGDFEEEEEEAPASVPQETSSGARQPKANIAQLGQALAGVHLGGGPPPAAVAPVQREVPREEQRKPEPSVHDVAPSLPPPQERPQEDPRSQPLRVPVGWTDEEVTDPNKLRAAPEGEEGVFSAAGGRNPRYAYPNSLLEGWVWKQSRLMKRWRRRYLVLTPLNLATYKQRGDITATESVMPAEFNTAFQADKEVLQSRSFCISVKKRNYFMVCDDDETRDTWVKTVTDTFAPGRS